MEVKALITSKVSKEVLGRVIKRHRNLNDMTIDQLAQEADISRNFLGEVERGNYNVSIKTLSKIACAVKRRLWEIIKEAEEETLKEEETKKTEQQGERTDAE
jgi:transcriptional regulator with XRE-family HTH domain